MVFCVTETKLIPGMMALPRTPMDIPLDAEIEKEAEDIVDVSSLPPG